MSDETTPPEPATEGFSELVLLDWGNTAHRKGDPRRSVRGAEVCRTCGEVRGSLRAVVWGGQEDLCDQRCSCEPTGAKRLAGLDFDIIVELCRCCGAEAIGTGSRWSGFYCRECHERAVGLNRDPSRPGGLPIGRHSAMNGITLGPDDDAEQFADDLQRLVGSIDRLTSWRRRRVKKNIRRLEKKGLLDPSEVIGLGAYLRGVHECGLADKEQAFEDLLDSLQRRTRSRAPRGLGHL